MLTQQQRRGVGDRPDGGPAGLPVLYSQVPLLLVKRGDGDALREAPLSTSVMSVVTMAETRSPLLLVSSSVMVVKLGRRRGQDRGIVLTAVTVTVAVSVALL